MPNILMRLWMMDCISGDRRKDRRYDLQMDLRFSYQDRGITYVGHGITLDISRGGVCFQTACSPHIGIDLELHVAWPFLLHGICPLELVIRGEVVRSNKGLVALRMRSHEFQTKGERSFTQRNSGPGKYSIIA
jgi:hypothetical protein